LATQVARKKSSHKEVASWSLQLKELNDLIIPAVELMMPTVPPPATKFRSRFCILIFSVNLLYVDENLLQ
jgi:hypothetical protein